MKGDFSRSTFDPARHYASVLMQQGRVQVDADWNEQRAIDAYRQRLETTDVIGRSGTPAGDDGFRLAYDNGHLSISPGRYYVGGTLCECNGASYSTQPFLPTPPDLLSVLRASPTRSAVAYLDVWQRLVTALDDPHLREVALGGPDTSVRLQTVWQVRLQALTDKDPSGRDAGKPFTPSCTDAPTDFGGPRRKNPGGLNARTRPADPDKPCAVPPTAGYTRLDNQLYRIEIHHSGDLNSATFKWSRDNGTVVTAVVAGTGGREIAVSDVGPDDVLGFAPGQWVELVDDATELDAEPGRMLRVDTVDPVRRVITVLSDPGPVDLSRNPKLRRWDGGAVTNLSTDWIELEGGIEVCFFEGEYQTGDFWWIPARTATGEIEWPPYAVPNVAPRPQLAIGPQHDYASLGIITLNDDSITSASDAKVTVLDCRRRFRPLAECCCDTGPLQIYSISWPHGGTITADDLITPGLNLKLSEPISADLVDKGALQVTFTVTSKSSLIGQVWELAGDLTADGMLLAWTWSREARDALVSATGTTRGLLRIRLAGAEVSTQSTDGTAKFLDGQIRFRPVRSGSSTTWTPILPSGIGVPASDLTSWCELELTPELHAVPVLAASTSIPVTK